MMALYVVLHLCLACEFFITFFQNLIFHINCIFTGRTSVSWLSELYLYLFLVQCDIVVMDGFVYFSFASVPLTFSLPYMKEISVVNRQ